MAFGRIKSRRDKTLEKNAVIAEDNIDDLDDDAQDVSDSVKM